MIQTEYLPPPELHQLTGFDSSNGQLGFNDYVLKPDELLVKSPRIHPNVAGGIYALFGADDSLLYIGKAINLNLRINQHFYARKLGFKYYSAMDVPTNLMSDIEVAHIYALMPPGNSLYARVDNPLHGEMVDRIRKAWNL